METNFDIIFNQLIQALGWSFFHSIWQAILVAVLVLLIVSLKPNLNSVSKYRLFTGGLVVFLFFNVATFIYYLNGIQMPEESALISYGSWARVSGQMQEAQLMQQLLQGFQENISTIVLLWGIGFMLFSLRIFGGLIYIKSIKDQATEWTQSHLSDKLVLFKSKLALTKPVKILLSKAIQVPMTVGFLKPVILFPVALINQISTEELEAILAHELAHIKRYDFLINLLISFIESIYYYHPAVWWMSNQIKQERENCCDDMAMQLCEDKLSYAKSLMKAQEFQINSVPILAIGFSKNNQRLLDRIKRILEVPNQKSKLMEKIAASTLFLLLITVFAFSTENRGIEKTPVYSELSSNIIQDTIPFSKSETETKDVIKMKKDGSSFYLKRENGEIKKLKIDGKTIPKSEHENHQGVIDELLSQSPASPVPSVIHVLPRNIEGLGFALPPASIEIEELNDLLEDQGFPNFHNSLENFNFPNIPDMPDFPISGLQNFNFDSENFQTLPEILESFPDPVELPEGFFYSDDTSKTERRIIIKGSKEGEPVEIIINDDKVIINGDEYMDVERKVEIIDNDNPRSFMLIQSGDSTKWKTIEPKGGKGEKRYRLLETEEGTEWKEVELKANGAKRRYKIIESDDGPKWEKSDGYELHIKGKNKDAIKLYQKSLKSAEKKLEDAARQMEIQEELLHKNNEKLQLRLEKDQHKLEKLYEREKEQWGNDVEIYKFNSGDLEHSQLMLSNELDSIMHMSHDMITLMHKNKDAFAKAFDSSVYYFDGIDKGNFFDDVLIENGIIKPGQFYSMKLTNKKLKVNGKTVPDAVKKEIEKIYLDKYNAKLGRKSQFQLKTQARKK